MISGLMILVAYAVKTAPYVFLPAYLVGTIPFGLLITRALGLGDPADELPGGLLLGRRGLLEQIEVATAGR